MDLREVIATGKTKLFDAEQSIAEGHEEDAQGALFQLGEYLNEKCGKNELRKTSPEQEDEKQTYEEKKEQAGDQQEAD